MTEDKMVGWHHGLNGHEFEQSLGDGEGQGSLVSCSPLSHKESDTTEQQQYIIGHFSSFQGKIMEESTYVKKAWIFFFQKQSLKDAP